MRQHLQSIVTDLRKKTGSRIYCFETDARKFLWRVLLGLKLMLTGTESNNEYEERNIE